MWLEFATGEFSYPNVHSEDVLNAKFNIDVGQRDTLFRAVKNLQIQQIPIPMLLVLSVKGKGI
jgi:hypothetical protein